MQNTTSKTWAEVSSTEECFRQPRWSCLKTAALVALASINKYFLIFLLKLNQIIIKLVLLIPWRFRYRALKKVQPFEAGEEYDEQCNEGEVVGKNYRSSTDLRPLIHRHKKTIVLDLDGTLVHSMSDEPPMQCFDFVVQPIIKGVLKNYYVIKRPGVDYMLESLAEKFEIIVFTAALKEYASLILDKLDQKGLISQRLYRDSCKFVKGKFVKDLSTIGRDLRKVVIVDDKPYSYLFQPWNGIPIPAFTNDRNDRELRKLVKFFDRCDYFDDMRDAVRYYRKHITYKSSCRYL